MSTINLRIAKIIEHYGLNKNSFSKRIGIDNNVTIGNIVGGRLNKPSFEVLEKIMLLFDSINAEWLITGKGEMLKVQASDNIPIMQKDAICAMCQSKDQIIKIQEKFITRLERQLDNTDKESNEHKKKIK
jgi:hypothetical protein